MTNIPISLLSLQHHTGTGSLVLPTEAPISPKIIANTELVTLRMDQFLPFPENRVPRDHNSRRLNEDINSDSEDLDNSNISFVDNIDIPACT